MSVKSFKFVSPGIFVNEVDNSQLPRLPEEMGPVIIGRAERGPAMVPVKIESFSEFVETFGEPISGAEASDGWRQGNRIGPTYGAFAAQAYLRNGSPITFVRLLGEAHPDAALDDNKAGWKMETAHGIFLSTDGTINDNANTRLAGIIYTDSDQDFGAGTTLVQANVDAKTVKAKIAIPIKGTGTSGTAATQRLEIGANSDPEQDDTNHKIILKQLPNATNGAAAENCLDIRFDNTSFTDVIQSAGVPLLRLTIGTANVTPGAAGGTTLNAKALAEKIAASVNAIGHDVNITASAKANADATKHDVLFVSDFVGDGLKTGVADIINQTGLPGGNFTVGTITNGADSAAGVDSEKTFIVDFNPNSKNYIRSTLNTNPTLVNPNISGDPSSTTTPAERYFLGATFEQHISDMGNINAIGVKKLTGASAASYIGDAAAPSTPWVYSQFLGDPESIATRGTNLATSDLTKLFKFHSLYAGEWEQQNFKISIADISAPTDQFNRYGKFSVEVRSAKDHDSAPVVYERYSNVNLDPSSPRFIAAVIGDQKMVWRESERRYVHEGQYLNQSRFIRVELTPEVEAGSANPELLPFAFRLPTHELPLAAGLTAAATNLAPKIRLRMTTLNDVKLPSSKSAYFGLSTVKVDDLSRHDDSYVDIVRRMSYSDDLRSSEDGDLFSLDLIKPNLIGGNDGNEAEFDLSATDAMRARTAFNSRTTVNGVADAVDPSFQEVLAAGYSKFTMPLLGGTDGLDITEIEPFCDDRSGTSSASNYAFNSISKAIDIVSDPEVVECNLMAIPGVANEGLTNKLIEVCENRGDALAVIDLPGDYVPAGWNKTTEQNRLPQVTTAVSQLRSRTLNSSYGCAFFPWVQCKDPISSRLVWMPPSVVALGTMASSAASSELWFAPAGFTRGGLSNGAGGIPVVQTRLRLTSKDRDKLYEANINPIAQFPAEGIVIFGQKTLQVTPSALDRINVRRLMVHVKKEISRMAATTLFDQNLRSTWNRFLSRAEPFLASVKSRFGLSDYKIVLDETTTTPELVDRNIVYAKIFLKPARAIEFIAIDFVITNTGASFED